MDFSKFIEKIEAEVQSEKDAVSLRHHLRRAICRSRPGLADDGTVGARLRIFLSASARLAGVERPAADFAVRSRRRLRRRR